MNDKIYTILQASHSGTRWLVLFFLIITLLTAMINWQYGKSYTKSDRRWSLLTLIFAHIQLVMGLVLYFISPKVAFTPDVMENEISRFYTVEHFSLMLLAIIVITVGYSRAKRAGTDIKKFKTTFYFFLIALVLLLIGIPWPFQNYGAGWY